MVFIRLRNKTLRRKTIKMDTKKLSELLELGMVLAFLILVVVIYVPVSIWAEEKTYENESRFKMQNIYK